MTQHLSKSQSYHVMLNRGGSGDFFAGGGGKGQGRVELAYSN